MHHKPGYEDVLLVRKTHPTILLGWIDPLGLAKKCGQLKGMSLKEAKDLLSKWDKATYRTLADSIRDHAARHEFGDDIAKYLRKAANFNKKGATKKVLEDGATRWTRKGGEFLIERNGKLSLMG